MPGPVLLSVMICWQFEQRRRAGKVFFPIRQALLQPAALEPVALPHRPVRKRPCKGRRAVVFFTKRCPIPLRELLQEHIERAAVERAMMGNQCEVPRLFACPDQKAPQAQVA